MTKRILVPLCLSVLIDFATEAQSFYARRSERHFLLTAGTGTSTYLGELSNQGDYLDAEPNLLVGLQYYVNPRIAIRTEATWFRLSGSDAKAGAESRVPRNLSFFSNNLEFAATGTFNLLSNSQRFYQRPNFNLYLFAGLAVLRFNPKAEYQGQIYALQPLRTEFISYSRTVLAIPFGLGGRIKIGPFFNIAIEGGLRKTFTDYLDDVSTVHYDASSYSDPIALALADRGVELGYEKRGNGDTRGNPKTDDFYFLLNAKLEYYLPSDFSMRKKSKWRKSSASYRRKMRQGGAFQKRK